MRYLLIVLLISVGCYNPPTPESNKQSTSSNLVATGDTPSSKDTRFTIFTVGDCEYIEFIGKYDNRLFSVIHKGDCKNGIHYFMKVNK